MMLDILITMERKKYVSIPVYNISKDSADKIKRTEKILPKVPHVSRKKEIRSLQIDTTTALMTVNSFSKGHLKNFFKRSFRKIANSHIKNLLIDIRANGGGEINNYVLLLKYLSDKPFKVADSAYANDKTFRPYGKYISSSLFNTIGLLFTTHKKQDGKYHFRFWEQHVFQPKLKHHFDGNTYVLINGLTFSASTLFCNSVKGQPNVTLVGEETGGGWYGNSGIMIPDIRLPNTKLRVRLPYFRLVQYHHIAKKGTGVMPDVYIGPVYKDVISGRDTKMEWIKNTINKNLSN